ncbi:MAG: hypothetical protein JNK22_11665 [Rhodocyclaceae bacterium]|nr:hypothetical protein [Rhodocyclaceae bacterium]
MAGPSRLQERIRLPVSFFVMSVGATLCLAAGILGLVAPQAFPPLAPRPVAVTFLGCGLLLEFWSIAILVGAARRRPPQA